MKYISLRNTAFEGQNSVYLLDGDGPTTLVDTGVATPDVERDLRDALGDYDTTFADIDRVLVTHWHEDHAGLVARIQAESGCDVVAHEADAPLVSGDTAAYAAMDEKRRDLLAAWGTPAAKQEELAQTFGAHDDLGGEEADVTAVTDGDTVRAGDHEVEVVHLPGHAKGLSAFFLEREGRREAFVGDAILPKYTPNVGGADVRVDRPLATYLASLDRIVDLDLDRAWPGHRGPIIDPSGRARDIATHHDERTERVLDAVETRGTATAWEVSADLFGELHSIHILHGPGEAYAHLDHLARDGVLDATSDGYRLAD
ncbi:MBL fold metallo-hydrolase [Halocalculus aciditolerans]|uniref:MBL fold hydrolase n=1 Tax=Halocalculus aciditolerans TaxID=1383812 RepID=A0A830F708_9EURY|nr:MBL fold hydrolase [Halocalculus aciditolerans]